MRAGGLNLGPCFWASLALQLVVSAFELVPVHPDSTLGGGKKGGGAKQHVCEGRHRCDPGFRKSRTYQAKRQRVPEDECEECDDE